ncbi:MAG TPA: glycosyltransferase family 39 protein, partial [Gemmatimonadales bacterium]
MATTVADARPGVVHRPKGGFDWPRALAWLAGLVGTGMYTLQYVSRPPLLLDEVRLSLDIAGTSWIGLTRPLGYDQSAPLLFLWAEKLATLIGGVNEYSLRLLPFLASIAVLPLLWLVGRRVMGPPGAAVAVGIAAVSPLLLQYCRQVKPYSLDAVVGLALVWWALDWLDAPSDPRAARRLTLAGVVAVWLSTPAIFVLAGVLLTLAAVPGPQRPPRSALGVAAAAVLLSFAAAYLWIYRPAEMDPYIQRFWEGSLLAFWRPGLLARAWQGSRELVWQTFVGGATEPGAPGTLQVAVDLGSGPFLFLLAFGASRLGRWAGATRAALLYAPVGVAVAASLLGKYPLAARTMLFAVPLLALLAAAGGLDLIRSFRPPWRPAVAGLAGLCLFGSPLLLDSWVARHRVLENMPEA